MTAITSAAVESYEDQFERQQESSFKAPPRPRRRNSGRFAKRQRTAALGIRGRNRSRSVRRATDASAAF